VFVSCGQASGSAAEPADGEISGLWITLGIIHRLDGAP
jgi:hypothetical protein